ncbi:MAG: HAD hydrolase-like protein [Actinomycetota bacterium]
MTTHATTPPGLATNVLIDLDGTLSDSEPGIGRSLVHAFESCGYPAPDRATIRQLIGPPFEVSFPRLGIPVDDLERVIDAYRERYDVVGMFENELYDGAVEMLDQLIDAGHVLTLATAKPQEIAIPIVEHFGISDRFAHRVGALTEIGSNRRTKGEVITHALHLLGISPHDRIALDHVVMVGDRDHDVEGAHLNAIDCIGVTYGFGSRDELEGAGAVAVVDSPLDVVGAVAATYRSRQP